MTAGRQVPIAWDALEDAFENNAPEVHSYLQLDTGEVIRIVDGVADLGMHDRIMADSKYLCIDPVSSREQYRWMERFIATVEETELRHKLLASIDGKGAFRRFKDALMGHPLDRERWFTFRSARLKASMESWLMAHDIDAVKRPDWPVPTAEEVRESAPDFKTAAKPTRRARPPQVDAQRKRLHQLTESLPSRELDTAIAFLDFLSQRLRPSPAPEAAEPAMAASDSAEAEQNAEVPTDASDDGTDES